MTSGAITSPAAAITVVLEHLGPDSSYPVDELVADAIEGGWYVHAPQPADTDISRLRVGEVRFIVGADGELETVPSSRPARIAIRDFVARHGATPPAGN